MEALFFYLTATNRNGGTRQTERGLPASSFFLSHQPKHQMPTDFIEFASCDM